jgi:hypothetical protein
MHEDHLVVTNKESQCETWSSGSIALANAANMRIDNLVVVFHIDTNKES